MYVSFLKSNRRSLRLVKPTVVWLSPLRHLKNSLYFYSITHKFYLSRNFTIKSEIIYNYYENLTFVHIYIILGLCSRIMTPDLITEWPVLDKQQLSIEDESQVQAAPLAGDETPVRELIKTTVICQWSLTLRLVPDRVT